MSRRSRLTHDALIQIKLLYGLGICRTELGMMFGVNAATIYYHLGLRKPKQPKNHLKTYLDYVKLDCERRHVPYVNPRIINKNLWG